MAVLLAIAVLFLMAGPALSGTEPAEKGACAATQTGETISPIVFASRLSGVAPLAIFFDARDTTANATLQPFHDLEYRWTFSDPASGNWANGSRAGSSSRNEATGAIAAHVFEKPGTYKVSVEITDGTHTVKRDCLQIAVLDPDAFFIAERTVCLSASGDFVGCPPGARKIIDPGRNFAGALADYAAPGRRLLFHRGENWQAASPGIIRTSGPGILGAYGTGAPPRIQATSNGDAPILQLSSATGPEIRDWRVMDLEFDGNGHSGRHAIKGEGGFDQVTLLRVNLHHVRNGLLLTSSLLDWWNKNQQTPKHSLWDQIALVDSTITNVIGAGGAYSVYASARRFALLGNRLDNGGGGEHTVRLPSIVAGMVTNNTIQGQGNAAGGKHAFTLRAAVHGSGGVEGGQDTRWVMVSDNKFIGRKGSDWTVTYQPQASTDERVVDVITERNWFVTESDPMGTQYALVLFARNQTIRNNLFDLTGGRAHGGILVHDGLSVGSNQVSIFNNTFLSNDASNNFVGVSVLPGVANVTVRNNLAYAPRDSQARMIEGPAVASHNSTDAQLRRTDPRFGAKATNTPVGWKPLTGSYAIGTGTSAPVWSDFFRSPRPPHHLGAVMP